jgi:hypothetical protein
VVRERRLADGAHHLEVRQGLVVEILFGEGVVEGCDFFLEDFVVLLGLVHVLGGNFFLRVVGAHLVVIGVEVGLHPDQVDEAAELVFRTDGQVKGVCVAAELGADVVHRAEEVGARAVHLVDEANAGDAVLVHLAPDRLGLGLHAGDGAEHRDRTVEHAQGALHLGREVHVSGCVDDVDLVLDPFVGTALGHPARGDGRRSDGDAAFAFLLHPVGRRGAFVDFADLVDPTGVEEDAFGRRGFAGIDVGGNTDIAEMLEGNLAVLGIRRGKSGGSYAHVVE